MEKPILLRSHSGDSEKAKAVLTENKISVIEVFSDSEYGQPELIADGSCFSFDGFAEIKHYAETHKPIDPRE